jgi:dihydroorotase
MVGKGRIAVGYDADLVLVDRSLKRTIRDEEQQTKSKWSPWNGETLTGWPVGTWVGGQQVWNQSSGLNDQFRGSKIRFDHSRGGFWNTPDGIGT